MHKGTCDKYKQIRGKGAALTDTYALCYFLAKTVVRPSVFRSAVNRRCGAIAGVLQCVFARLN
eukprot:3626867-Amphidinium_carterae.3